ncbi:uroporphyrinogen decarboxylase family protein [Methanosarcina sp. T3]|uniref:uroporphyrinogen decarboxylase family protein n=1 Tax=Methanosarcina sp. T3 TaxID=3439062 RepID=UPI003F8514C5
MASRMTSAERMAAVISGQKPDRVPVIPFIEGYASQITGISLGDFYADGDKCFEAQFASMRLHGYEQTPMYGYASCGAWEFGGEIGFPYGKGQGAPFVKKHPVETIEDIDKLEVPDFGRELPGAYKIADRVATRCFELGMPATVQIGSIFTAASVVADTSEFLAWLIMEPKAVHLLLDKVSDMFVNALDYFADKYGSESLLPFDGGPSESNNMISPQMFEEFAYPYMKKVHTRVKELGIHAVLMHPCANQNLNLPYYAKLREETNWSGKYFWLFGPETPIKDQIKAFGDHDVICGNINPPLFLTNSYEELLEICRRNIEEGINSPSGYVLSPGCEFPVNAAPVKVMAMVDAAEKYGRYE